MINYIREYYSKIESGEIVTSKRIRQVYKKLVYELDNPKENWIFDIDLATKPIDFIERFCKHSKGKWMGKPIYLELFQKALIQATYGFVDRGTKLRRVREVFVICGRKNGKSVLTSGLGLYAMCEEKGGQVTCVASKLQQALIVFDEARHMVEQSPYLSKHIRKRKMDMYMDCNFSSFIPLSSESKRADGLNVNFGISDEIHANIDRNAYDVIKQSQSAREQPIMFTISTAGFVREGLYDTMYKYGCDILDEIIVNDAFLPFFYELDDKAEIDNSDCYIKANPALGVIKSIDELKANVERAKVDSTFMPTVLTKDFNIRETITGSWLSFEDLNNTATFDLEMFRGSYCMGGVDLSDVGDLTCATIICMRRNDPVKYIHQMYFIPSETAEQKIKTDKVPYNIWRYKGYVTYCQGKKVNYSDVTKWFTDTVINKYGIIPMFIGYDYAMTRYWLDEMISNGFTDKIMTQVRQGFVSVSPIMKEMEIDFKIKLINYNNNPVLKWCLSNTQVISDPAGNIKFDKRKNKHMRNDGMTSLYDAYKPLLDNYQNFQNMIKD